ncbi:MAG: hypothetical protein ABI151_05305 [Chitinophagaceae bacterium]
MKNALALILLILGFFISPAQNYHAVQGSSFAGSLGIDNNPASIVNTPSPWDITVLSFQLKYATSAVKVLNYSLLGSPADSKYRFSKGDFSRFGTMNLNLHILNARVALKRKQAIAFGMNLKSYSQINASQFNISDTVRGINDFLVDNQKNPYLHARLRSSSWLELFATYSKTLLETNTGRLNGGITVRANRGVAGGFMNFQNVSFKKDLTPTGRPDFKIQSAALGYGYSSNFDKWTKSRSTRDNLRDMVISSEGGASVDLGVEYLVRGQVSSSFYDDDNYYDYDWKIGVSLLDIGKTNFKPGRESRIINDPTIGVSAIAFEKKFKKIYNFQSFNDSIATAVDGISSLSGVFGITNPARLVINADHWMGGDFYVNGELSVNLSAVPGIDALHVSEMNFLTFTPRWETRKYGLYLPMQYNTGGQFWVGGAFKFGPIVGGLHNLGNVFSRNKMQNGGGYFALVIRPSSLTKKFRDARTDCPRISVSGRRRNG